MESTLSSDPEAASGPAPRFDPERAASEIWAEAQRALARGTPDEFSNQAVKQLMTAAVKLFCARLEKDDQAVSPVLGEGDLVTATEVVVAVSALMRAAGLNPFDLAMWFNRKQD